MKNCNTHEGQWIIVFQAQHFPVLRELSEYDRRKNTKREWREGREREMWERPINWLPTAHAPTRAGDQTCNQGRCPRLWIKPRPFGLWAEALTTEKLARATPYFSFYLSDILNRPLFATFVLRKILIEDYLWLIPTRVSKFYPRLLSSLLDKNILSQGSHT